MLHFVIIKLCLELKVLYETTLYINTLKSQIYCKFFSYASHQDVTWAFLNCNTVIWIWKTKLRKFKLLFWQWIVLFLVLCNTLYNGLDIVDKSSDGRVWVFWASGWLEPSLFWDFGLQAIRIVACLKLPPHNLGPRSQT